MIKKKREMLEFIMLMLRTTTATMMMVDLRVDRERADRTKERGGVKGVNQGTQRSSQSFSPLYPQLLTIVSATLVQIMVLVTTPFMATDVRVLKALLGHFARKVRQQFVCFSLLKWWKRKEKYWSCYS